MELKPQEAAILTARQTPIIFLIDDNKLLSDYLSRILSEAGFHVLKFYDPLEALQLASTLAPDIVVTNYEMPTFDGLDFASWVESHFPRCPIVLISGNTMNLEGNCIVLEKHATSSEVVAAVKRELRWQ